MGEKHPFYGKHHSVETKRKMSLAKLRRKHTDDAKRKVSLTLRRRKHMNDST